MKVERFELGPFMTNAYLIYDRLPNKGIVIDPGMGPGPLIERIKELQLEITTILLTHAHCDHIGGLEELRLLTKAPVYVHAKEEDWLTNPALNGSALLPGFAPISCQAPEHLLQGGEVIQLFNQPVKVIHTPGHSPGSITFILGDKLFSGDVLFMDSIGRTDLPGGDYTTLMNSIGTSFLPLSDETTVYPGHGPITTIGRERMRNPFIRGG